MTVRSSVLLSACAGVALGALGMACSSSTVEGGGPLSITLTVTPLSVAVGDSIRVETQATGTLLAGTIIEFGDGRVDSINAQGAVTQGVRILDHFYSAAGTYLVRATIEDLEQGSQSATATVQVNDP